jgi:hypothetical protein
MVFCVFGWHIRYLRKNVLPSNPEITFALAGRSATKVWPMATGCCGGAEKIQKHGDS